jgi:hypothetical protein
MPARVLCLFALQTARATKTGFHCTSNGCDFLADYDQVCAHEKNDCPVLHKRVPCLVEQLGQKLMKTLLGSDMKHSLCPQICKEKQLREESISHHRFDKQLKAKSYVECRLYTTTSKFFIPLFEDSTHDKLVLYNVVQDKMMYLLVVRLNAIGIPQRVQFTIRRQADDREEGSHHGLRLEGNIMPAMRVLDAGEKISFHPDNCSLVTMVHMTTLQPYLRGSVAEEHIMVRVKCK